MAPDIISKILGGMLGLFGFATAIGLAGALFTHFQDEDIKAAAREAGPPQLVAIEAYETRQHTGPGAEVRLRARIRPDQTMIVADSYTGWVTPLYAVEAEAGAEGAQDAEIGWLVGPPDAYDRAPGQAAIPGLTLTPDDAGDVLTAEIRGVRVDPRLHASPLKALGAAADVGLIVVEPFQTPRTTYFAPNLQSRYALSGALALAALLTLYGGWLAIRR